MLQAKVEERLLARLDETKRLHEAARDEYAVALSEFMNFILRDQYPAWAAGE